MDGLIFSELETRLSDGNRCTGQGERQRQDLLEHCLLILRVHAVPCHTIPCHATSHCVIPHHGMSCHQHKLIIVRVPGRLAGTEDGLGGISGKQGIWEEGQELLYPTCNWDGGSGAERRE